MAFQGKELRLYGYVYPLISMNTIIIIKVQLSSYDFCIFIINENGSHWTVLVSVATLLIIMNLMINNKGFGSTATGC